MESNLIDCLLIYDTLINMYKKFPNEDSLKVLLSYHTNMQKAIHEHLPKELLDKYSKKLYLADRAN